MVFKPRVLFVSLTNDVGSDRLVGEFGRHGSACAVLGPAGCYAGLSRFATKRFAVPARLGVWATSVLLRPWLTAAVDAWSPDRVVPLDELSALLLRAIAASETSVPPLRSLLVHSLGDPAGYPAACHRVPLMDAAVNLKVRTPWFSDVLDPADPPPFPLVVKRDHSSGSGGIAIVESRDELAAALRRLRLRHAAKSALAFAAGYRHGRAPILFQQFIQGRLAMRTVACQDGRVLDGISFEAIAIHPTKRASTMLRRLDSREMEHAADAIVAELGCSGFVSFDFIVDEQDRAFLIEMNPRPIGSTHLGKLFGHDLCKALIRGAAAPDTPSSLDDPDQIIAMFPKELERDPQSACLDRGSGIRHDLPVDDPAVVDAYFNHLVRVHPARADEIRRRLGAAVRAPLEREPWLPKRQIAH